MISEQSQLKRGKSFHLDSLNIQTRLSDVFDRSHGDAGLTRYWWRGLRELHLCRRETSEPLFQSASDPFTLHPASDLGFWLF